MVEHIVLMKLKEEATESQTNAILEGLKGLQNGGSISGIESVSGGYNNSPEGKGQGYDWGFTLGFASLADRDAYLPHTDHKALSQNLIRPIVEDVLVFDYES